MSGAARLAFGPVRIEDLSLAHEVQVSPQSGSLVTRVPIPLTAAGEQAGPALAIEYNSGSGNSPYGWGWVLTGVPAVAIDTRRGLPRYDGSDTYLANGSELTAMVRIVGGRTVPWVEDLGTHWVRYYRARFERTFVRWEQWREKAGGRVHWRCRSGKDAVTVLGADAAGTSRVCDPEQPERVYAWLEDAQFEADGRAVRYHYAPEDGAGVPLSSMTERPRARGGVFAQRYLKRVEWGNTKPLTALGAEPAGNAWCFEAVFDYGDHRAQNPAPAPDQAWPVRQDPFSTCRPGFEVRTYRLCRRVLQFHRFAELGPDAVLVAALSLAQREAPGGATLGAIRYTGYRREAAGVWERSLPDLRFEYARPAMGSAFQAAPAITEQNLPHGLTGPRYRWVDLYGEGLPGILAETEQAWYFKPNEGGGRFGDQVRLAERPSYRFGRVALTDFDRDGNVNLLALQGREAGSYEFDRESATWSGYRTFDAVPHLESAGSRVQWMDVNGDGQPDLLLPGAEKLRWYASRGEKGFAAPQETAKPEAAPVEEDPTLGFFFADMNSDGLPDQVRIRNGCVEYWPNLGNGRFGTSVSMEDAPVLDTDAEFDPSRIRLVDLDGDGGADLLYLGRGQVRIWMNLSGNRFGPGQTISNLPYVDQLSSAQILDFLGDGSTCLVWSTPLESASSISYLPLTGEVKPRLLVSVNNSMGRETRLEYGSSAAHYLRARRSGRPWRTRLPSHVTVVERVETLDAIGGARSTRRFEYRDGVYDGEERAFRGFGQADQYDSTPAAAPDEPAVTPCCTRTWFHTGEEVEARAEAFGWYADPQQELPAPCAIEGAGLLSSEEERDAWRTVAGETLRREVFGVNAAGRLAPHPFQVTQFGYGVRRLAAAEGDRPARLLSWTAEQVSIDYEQQPGDPRMTQHLSLGVDDFGCVLFDCDVVYPRRAVPAGAPAAQGAAQVTATRHRFAHVERTDRRLLAVPVESEEFEISGLNIAAPALLRPGPLAALLQAALAAPLAQHEAFGGGVQARRSEWDRSYYWDDAQAAPLPLGGLGARLMIHHEESACWHEDATAALFGGRVANAQLVAARYVLADRHWWQVDATHVFGDAASFNMLQRMVRLDGGFTAYRFDAYQVVALEVTDDRGNRTTAVMDYHRMAPARITGPNGDVAEMLYDPLGAPAATTVTGRVLDPAGGRQPYGQEPLAAWVRQTPNSVADVLADPERYLQGAATFAHYELDSWTAAARPPSSVLLVREGLRHDGAGGGAANARIQISVAHYDGFRRALQSKVQVDPGPALERDAAGRLVLDAAGVPVETPAAERWLVSGHTVFNAKQQAVRSYEPFYSPTAAFEPEEALRHYGVASETTYDSLGRVVREDLPHGCFRSYEHLAWESRRADENDNVRGSPYAAVRSNLPANNPERQALDKADAHAGTITSVDLDGAGQVVRWRMSTGGAPRVWQVRLDHRGKAVEATDARGLIAYTRVYDMLARQLHATSIDAGESVSLPDALDRVVDEWNAAGLHVHSTYDTLDRLTRCEADGAPDAAGVVEQRVYGDDPGVAQAAERNALGRLVMLRDSAGVLEVPRFDPSGGAMETERRLCADYRRVPDWTNPANVALDPEVYRTAARRDAMGRTLQETLPDEATRVYEYARGGFLSRIRISSADGLLNDDVVDGTEYNARGQLVRGVLGNGVAVESQFDGETYRPVRVTATRPALGAQPATILQDLTYTYDPVGNIVRCLDAAQEPAGAGPAFLTGVNVSSVCEYTYDPLYQLTQATGRVHQALLERDWMPDAGRPLGDKGTRHLNLNNGAAIERYSRSYTYDISGNLTRIQHQGQTNQWVTDMWVSAASNRALPARDLAGNPLANPEARFDAVGNCHYLPHIPTLDWNWQNGISRAVIVDRSGAGQPDDAEYYVYDGDGQRVRKVLERLTAGQVERTETIYFAGGQIRRIRRGAQVLVERLTSDVGAAGRVALIQRWRTDLLNRETANIAMPRFRYVLAAPTGSSLLELDDQGHVITYEEYFPFGGTAFLAGDDQREVATKDYRYSGKERDDVTGLYYFGYRYFAPYIGRWMSPDPAGTSESLNLYEYARNNPVSRVDHDGTQSQSAVSQGDYRRIPVEQVPEQFRAPYSRLSNEQLRQFNRNQANFYQSPDGKIEFLPLREVQKRIEANMAKGGTVNDLRLEPKSNDKPATGDGSGQTQAPDLSANDPGPPSQGDGKDGAGDGKDQTSSGQQPGDGGQGEDGGGGLQGPGGNGEEKNNDRNLGMGNTGTGDGGGGESDRSAGSGTEAGDGMGAGAEGEDTGADQEESLGEDEEGQDDASVKGTKDGDPAGAGEQNNPSNLPPSEGLLPAPADLKVNGNDPNGAPDGSSGSARETSRTGTGRPGNGARHPGGSGPGEDPNGQQQTFWDKAAHLAGYLNFEFGAGDREHGASGGLPGGGGSLNLGAVGQALYVVATVVSTIVAVGEIIAAIKLVAKVGLRAALRLALTRIKESITALRGALREAASLLEQGFRGLRSRLGLIVQTGGVRAKRKFTEWLNFFGDKGGVTQAMKRTGSFFNTRYHRITTTIKDAEGTWGWIDTNAHENFHVWVFNNLPRFARLQEVTVFGQPVFAPLAWAEETVAWSVGRVAARRFHALPLAPLQALGSLEFNEVAVNAVYFFTGAFTGAAYVIHRLSDRHDKKESP